jgi:hypothetical protein
MILVLSTRWRLLGPLKTIDGMVMFGISTAMIFALIMRLIEQRMKAKVTEMDINHEIRNRSEDRT